MVRLVLEEVLIYQEKSNRPKKIFVRSGITNLEVEALSADLLEVQMAAFLSVVSWLVWVLQVGQSVGLECV